jgi:hypothetical protein
VISEVVYLLATRIGWQREVRFLGTVIAAAERRGIAAVATLDRRHFGIVRPKHTETFQMLP